MRKDTQHLTSDCANVKLVLFWYILLARFFERENSFGQFERNFRF